MLSVCSSMNAVDNKLMTGKHFLEGVLDKYNIYLFTSNSIEDFKLNLH